MINLYINMETFMENPFKYSNDNKRYHTWNYYLKNKFGQKVCKIPLYGAFTCPNIDGSKGVGGCVFCSGRPGFEIFDGKNMSIRDQVQAGKIALLKKWPNALFLPYFQYNSGTYAALDRLKFLYQQALKCEEVVGLCIATRADCLQDDVCEYLSNLNRQTNLYVELGLQTIHDKTAEILNRNHTYREFLVGYGKLISRGIKVCVHIMNSLPGETRQMMIETAREVSRLKPFGLKIHMLYVTKGTMLKNWYDSQKFSLMSREEYINTVCDQLEFLSPEIVIERLTGDCLKKDLVAPIWSLKKVTILNDIDKELVRRNSFQGIKYMI